MKKSILIVLSFFFTCTLVTGMGAEDAKPTGPVEIEFWTMQLSPAFDDYINGVITKFEILNPDVIVNWVDVPWGDMETRILAAAASGDMPDIANLNPHFAQELAQNDALLNMDDWAGDVKSLYFKGAWDANKFDGKTFALPWYLTTPILFYNKELFEASGLDPEAPPETYEEILSYAEKITAATGKYGFMPILSNQAAMEGIEQAGIRLFNDDFSKAQFTNIGVLSIIKKYKDMMDRKVIPPQSLNDGTLTALKMFSAGQIAMFNGGTSHAGMIKNNSEDMYSVTGIGAQPVGPKGKRNVEVMNIAVSSSTVHTEESVRFAKFITNGENQVEFSKAAGAIVPSITGAETSDFFTVSDGTAVADARIISAAQVIDAQVIFPPIHNFTIVSEAFLNALQKILLEGGDLVEVFQIAENEADSALDDN